MHRLRLPERKDHSQCYSDSEVCEIDVLIRSRFTVLECICDAVEQTSERWDAHAHAHDSARHYHTERGPPYHVESRHGAASQSTKKEHEICLDDVQSYQKEDDG